MSFSCLTFQNILSDAHDVHKVLVSHCHDDSAILQLLLLLDLFVLTFPAESNSQSSKSPLLNLGDDRFFPETFFPTLTLYVLNMLITYINSSTY